MPEPSVNLTCPGCGKGYSTYKDYFACWTSHLEEGLPPSQGVAPNHHAEAINYYKRNPQDIEPGIRILASEVGVFRGRIDLIGVDKEKNLVLIDVTDGTDWKRKSQQLKRYKRNIEWMGSRIFGLRESPPMRLLVVRPNQYTKEVK